MHSNRSDGDLSPTELMRKCREQGVDYPILTDHDTVAGTKEAMIASQKLNIKSSAGIELSSVHNGRGLHILGLGIDYQNKILL
ncbi:PHP domain-containing protein, partial [Candidatus Parcubacteria bacterium]|nr:PHP domain-containing protein [Candidatus Parcubacteria bacterium]